VKALVAIGKMLLKDVLYTSQIIPEKVHPALRLSVLLWHNTGIFNSADDASSPFEKQQQPWY